MSEKSPHRKKVRSKTNCFSLLIDVPYIPYSNVLHRNGRCADASGENVVIPNPFYNPIRVKIL